MNIFTDAPRHVTWPIGLLMIAVSCLVFAFTYQICKSTNIYAQIGDVVIAVSNVNQINQNNYRHIQQVLNTLNGTLNSPNGQTEVLLSTNQPLVPKKVIIDKKTLDEINSEMSMIEPIPEEQFEEINNKIERLYNSK